MEYIIYTHFVVAFVHGKGNDVCPLSHLTAEKDAQRVMFMCHLVIWIHAPTCFIALSSHCSWLVSCVLWIIHSAFIGLMLSGVEFVSISLALLPASLGGKWMFCLDVWHSNDLCSRMVKLLMVKRQQNSKYIVGCTREFLHSAQKKWKLIVSRAYKNNLIEPNMDLFYVAKLTSRICCHWTHILTLKN